MTKKKKKKKKKKTLVKHGQLELKENQMSMTWKCHITDYRPTDGTTRKRQKKHRSPFENKNPTKAKQPGHGVIQLLFMLNSAGHEIYPAHKC